MARAAKLKVFRTPIGFHDAYVAAPSQKAALAAWGADSNLFATGSAEAVEDPELTREPLANPGQVIRKLRGTLAEHVAALPKAQKRADIPVKAAEPRAARKPAPRPSRSRLDRAEAALAALEARQAKEAGAIATRQAALDRARQALAAKQQRESATAQARLDAARDTYESAMQAWRDS